MKNLTGIVEECKTERPAPVRIVTELKVSSFEHGKTFRMFMHGKHRIDKGETIRAYYEICTGIHWISHYDVLDENSDILYSSISD